MLGSRPQDANPHWFCAQIGAREHYAVPRALHQIGRPVTLYTDFWAGLPTKAIINGFRIRPLIPLAARFHPELGGNSCGATLGCQPAEVCSWNLRALFWEMILRRRKSVGQSQGAEAGGSYQGFIEVGRRFSLRVREAFGSRRNLGAKPIFYAYDTGALEAFEWCRQRGIKCVLNQMDPNRTELALVKEEEKHWPGWVLQTTCVPEEYFQRREQEWALADRIVVNSEFSRQALLQQGVPAAKLVVIPLCYEAAELNRKSEIGNRKSNQPLHVLFLGQVILRKGIQYLLAAARQLERENIRFDIVGPIGISAKAVATAPGNVTFHGRTGRGEAAAWYRQSHVFVLPTLSDGFAITQLEAMAHGLPVVATACCGAVVADGVDGFVAPPRAVEALVQAFRRYLTEPELLRNHSAAALVKARQFTLPRLAENLQRLENDLWQA